MSSSTTFGSSAGDLSVANEPNITKKTALCILDILRAARLVPLDIHLPEVLVGISLVAIFDARLKLTDEFLETSLQSLDPPALKTFDSYFQGPPEVTVASIRAQLLSR